MKEFKWKKELALTYAIKFSSIGSIWFNLNENRILTIFTCINLKEYDC